MATRGLGAQPNAAGAGWWTRSNPRAISAECGPSLAGRGKSPRYRGVAGRVKRWLPALSHAWPSLGVSPCRSWISHATLARATATLPLSVDRARSWVHLAIAPSRVGQARRQTFPATGFALVDPMSPCRRPETAAPSHQPRANPSRARRRASCVVHRQASNARPVPTHPGHSLTAAPTAKSV